MKNEKVTSLIIKKKKRTFRRKYAHAENERKNYVLNNDRCKSQRACPPFDSYSHGTCNKLLQDLINNDDLTAALSFVQLRMFTVSFETVKL